MYPFATKGQIKLQRDCKAILIPDGISEEIKKGSRVNITQVLGGMFTVEREDGCLMRIDGIDADALGEIVPKDRKSTEDLAKEGKPVEDMVLEQLKTCYDPEIPVNIIELGIIYKCEISPIKKNVSSRVDIEMTLTAPGCGMGEVIKGDVESKVLDVPGVETVNVELTFDPPWEFDMMSEAAKLQLGML